MQCLKMKAIKVPERRKLQLNRKNKNLLPTKGGTHFVPCGECAFCLVNRRSGWMFRVYHEMRTQWHRGHFLTLTYDERHVKRLPGNRLSLRFRDVQLFLKRLRKARYYCKYICVGEYGPQTQRPHYHMLLWTDCPEHLLESNWKMGHIQFGKLTMASAMYTLKYIIQPKVRDQDVDIPLDERRERTRAQFSKGLGLAYLDKAAYHYHTEDYENPILFSIVDGRKVALPRYYRNKIFTKYQLREVNELMREKAMTDTSDEIRRALKVLAYKKCNIAERLKEARRYVQSLRVENARLILSTTKYNLKL